MTQKRDAAGRPARRKAASGPGPVELIIARHRGEKRALIPILQDLEERDGWLAPEIMDEVARRLDLSPAHVYSVATFYKAFSLKPRGRHRCTVCMGTACHVRGGAIILEHFERKLGIRAGQTSPDGEFTLERVNCLGACALAPLVVMDGRYHGQMTEIRADAVLKAVGRKTTGSKGNS
jgi:NADH-quinone oxidoreductase subunit E